ncbi:hypothetical protein VTJ04DRAFT_7292 [Mycothermus thermophilus]|uniref:uncharacterized protein n=1 Tax=Humicola insolens TaxID=85995 RepID=UPI00374494D0
MSSELETKSCDSSSSIIYQPLDDSRREIRVLWLLPPSPRNGAPTTAEEKKAQIKTNGEDEADIQDEEDDGDPIRVELATVSLSDRPAYTALSYIWGDPAGPYHRIFLNGQPFKVRVNLRNCLRRLRQFGVGARTKQEGSPDTPRSDPDTDETNSAPTAKMVGIPLWIDALCINQNDMAERTSQVMLMGDLYRHAAAVISWLGEHKHARGFPILREIAYQWEQCSKEVENEMKQRGVKAFELLSWPPLATFFKATRHLWHDENAIKILVTSSMSEYWMRVWIVQELVLSNPASHIYMSSDEIVTEAEFDCFSSCISTVFGDPDFAVSVLHAHTGNKTEQVCDYQLARVLRTMLLNNLEPRNTATRIQRGVAVPNWLFVLHIADMHYSSDPRDSVYGLLHLIPQSSCGSEVGCGQDMIIPDYNRPARDVYIDWARRAILECRDLRLLSYAGTGLVTSWVGNPNNITELNVPSWVPDLHNRPYGYRAVDYERLARARYRTVIAKTRVLPHPHRTLFMNEEDISGDDRALFKDPNYPDAIRVRFFLDYLSARKSAKYPVPGVPPFQALLRLAAGALIEDLETGDFDPQTEPRIHKMAMSFAFWLMVTWASLKASGQFDKLLPEIECPKEEMPPGHVHENNGCHCQFPISLLGFSWTGDFVSEYRTELFPDVDVEAVTGWKDITTALSSLPLSIVDVSAHIHALTGALFVTEDGHVGIGPWNAQPGDFVYEVEHCPTPLVLRRHDGNAESGPQPVTLLGACGVVGIGDRVDDKKDMEYDEELLIV